MKPLCMPLVALALPTLIGCAQSPETFHIEDDSSIAAQSGALSSSCETIETKTVQGVCQSPDQWKDHAVKLCGDAAAVADLKVFGQCANAKDAYLAATISCCGATDPAPTPTPTPKPNPEPCDNADGTSCEPKPEPPAQQPCKTVVMGDVTSCKPADVWKQYAHELCNDNGLQLSALSLGDQCKGGFVQAKVACCPKDEPSPCDSTTGNCEPKPEPCVNADGTTCDEPNPQPEPNQCFAEMMGGNTSCKPAEVWKQYASEICADANMILVGIGVDGECDKGAYSHAKFECCAKQLDTKPPVNDTKPPSDNGETPNDGTTGSNDPAPEPTPSSLCKADLFGAKDLCMSEDEWVAEAQEICGDSGMELSKIRPHYSCGKGSFSFAKIQCCATADEAPQCRIGKLAAAGQCLPADKLEAMADNMCGKHGLVLNGAKPFADCATGGFQAVKFQCCAD